jgi:4,5-dihydroxyphthalate decarboxylase
MVRAIDAAREGTVTRLTLSLGVTVNPRTWPILDGSVTPDAIDLVTTPLDPSELFWRQLKFGEFDISEMSISSLLIAVNKGDDRFVALPVCTTRRFFHSTILVRRDAGIERPEDLKGKRVGVPEYQQTAALWTRGALQHEWGVTAQDMTWWMERPQARSHGGATGSKPPKGVTIHEVPADKSLGSMMMSGELQAVVHYIRGTNLVDRSTVDLRTQPEIRTLFPDTVAEGARYWKKTGILPINHAMVVKREVYEDYPWVVLNVLKAFREANAIAEQQRLQHVEYHGATGLMSAESAKGLRTQLIDHSVATNRLVFETAADYSFEQGLTNRRMKLEEIFAPSVMED